jgi:hypothetical protein
MTSPRALRILLALALLAVWQGALLHPLQHVDAKGAFVHVPGTHLPKSPGDKSSSNPSCDAIAAVTACVSSAVQPALAAVAGVETPLRRNAGALLRAPVPAYRSQAPPTLL